MMDRVLKILKNFPNLFQPSRYGRRSRKESDEDIDQDLRLPQLTKQKSHSIPQRSGQPLPVIRILRSKSLKNGSKNLQFSSSENNLTLLNNNLSNGQHYTSNSNNSINKNYNYHYKNISESDMKRGSNKLKGMSTSDVPRIVADVIDAASVRAKVVERQIVRIINGADPSVQSQVLLNTKTSQPWTDLVKDLGAAVGRNRRYGTRMETLYGRPVHSYSQLRSELKVGNNAFYIYADSEEEDNSMVVPNLQRHRLSLIPSASYGDDSSSRVRRSSSNVSARSRAKVSLSKTISNSSSELSMQPRVQSPRRRHRRRSHTLSPAPTPAPSPKPDRHNPDGRKSLEFPERQRRKKSVVQTTSRSAYSNNLEVRSVHFH